MNEIIVPANIKVFRKEAAEEMSRRDPLDTSSVSALGATALLPKEVLSSIEAAAQRRGVDLTQYLVDSAYRQSLYDLTGADYD